MLRVSDSDAQVTTPRGHRRVNEKKPFLFLSLFTLLYLCSVCTQRAEDEVALDDLPVTEDPTNKDHYLGPLTVRKSGTTRDRARNIRNTPDVGAFRPEW